MTSTANGESLYEMDKAFAAARAICRHHARSFYFASVFLPSAKRNAAYAVYAFCRLLDDATDEAEDAAGVAGQIERFVGLLDAVYDQSQSLIAGGGSPGFGARPGLPPPAMKEQASSTSDEGLALIAFAQTVRKYDIPKSCFLELAEGCRMDLTIDRYQSWDDLRKYCYRVAGVVGIVMCRIFGVSDPAAEAQAVMMGEAMQLTNILRDVKEDAARGRVYLPMEDLDRFGYTIDDLQAGVVNEPFRQLMRFEIARARDLYRQSAVGLAQLTNDGSRLTATAMGVIYAGILRAIESQGYDVFNRRARLNLMQKLLRLPAAWKLSSRGIIGDAF
jgi:phytoene synthase